MVPSAFPSPCNHNSPRSLQAHEEPGLSLKERQKSEGQQEAEGRQRPGRGRRKGREEGCYSTPLLHPSFHFSSYHSSFPLPSTSCLWLFFCTLPLSSLPLHLLNSHSSFPTFSSISLASLTRSNHHTHTLSTSTKQARKIN